MTIERARSLRKEMTPPERRLWTVLKDRPGGLKFRRQHPLGPYVLDFFCHEAGVAIEIDGLAHELGGNPERDIRRDAWMAGEGILTLRFRAIDVRDQLEGVIASIVEECVRRSPSSGRPLHRLRRSPSPANAGEARGCVMIRLYDTMAREKRPFDPPDPQRITMYVCGPTVYGSAHIGNARPAVVFDTLARLIRHEYRREQPRLCPQRHRRGRQDHRRRGEGGRRPLGDHRALRALYLEDMGALGVLAAGSSRRTPRRKSPR